MPGLLKLLRKLRKSDSEMKLAVIGLDNSGKTTILRHWTDGQESTKNIMPTQGFNISEKTMDGFKIQAWDLGGQKSIRKYWKAYFDGVDVLVYVVDSADEERMEESQQELASVLVHKDLDGVPLVVVANKQDLLSAAEPEELFQLLKLDSYGGRSVKVIGCSAKTGEGLQETTESIVKAHREHKDTAKNAGAAAAISKVSVSGGTK